MFKSRLTTNSRLTSIYRLTALAVALSLTAGLQGCASTSSKSTKNQVVEIAKDSDSGYLKSGLRALKANQYEEASKKFEAIETFYPVTDTSENAVQLLMYSRYMQGDYSASRDAAERFIRNYPASTRLDYAYYVRALSTLKNGYDGILRAAAMPQAQRDIGFLGEARLQFSELVTRYPFSPYASSAQQLIKQIDNELAENELNAARFNMQRGSYLGAIDRAKTILLNYPNSTGKTEALAILVASYDTLNISNLKTEYAQQLKDMTKNDYRQVLSEADRKRAWYYRFSHKKDSIEYQMNNTVLPLPPETNLSTTKS